MTLETRRFDEFEYVCAECEYRGDEYDRQPTAPAGKQVRCPECQTPALRRELV